MSTPVPRQRENRLAAVTPTRQSGSGGSGSLPTLCNGVPCKRVFFPLVMQQEPVERYSYDADGARVRKETKTEITRVIGPHYEVTVQVGSGQVLTTTKYYDFGGQRIAIRQVVGMNQTLSYLHGDQLGSTSVSTNNTGATTNDVRYTAYGGQRSGNVLNLPTDHTFTGQKLDRGTGLMYYGARYYDSALGMFVSPDSLVPEPGDPLSLNRYAYVRNNALRYTDPTGHTAACAAFGPTPFAIACEVVTGIAGTPAGQQLLQQVESLAVQYSPAVIQLLQQWGDKLPALVDWAGQAVNGSQQTASQAGNTANPGGLGPNGPFSRFSNLVHDRGADALQRNLQSEDTSHRLGAERVLKVMDKLGDKVQRVNVDFKGQNVSGDIDILETTGNIHSIGGPRGGAAMSDVWVSSVYFELQAECDYQRVSNVLRQLVESGLVFDPVSAQWISPDGMNTKKVVDLEAALTLTVQHRGGAINLYEAETDTSILVSYHPCGGGILAAEDAAERTYGYASLFMNYAYLRELRTDSPEVIRHRYELAFRWSNVLARATNAIYGWGDMESIIWDTGYIVSASELKQGGIPRFGWWNYFSKEFIARIGKNRIFSTGIWLTEETEGGWVVILRPPGIPIYADHRERNSLRS